MGRERKSLNGFLLLCLFPDKLPDCMQSFTLTPDSSLFKHSFVQPFPAVPELEITYLVSWFQCSIPGWVPCRMVRLARPYRRWLAIWKAGDLVAIPENRLGVQLWRFRLLPDRNRWSGRVPWRYRWPLPPGSGWSNWCRRPSVWPVCWILRMESYKRLKPNLSFQLSLRPR